VSIRGVRLFGETRVPIVLARFSNGPEPQWTRSEVQQRLFGGADGGLVNLPFHVASSGRFSVVGEFSPWVQTTVPSSGDAIQFAFQAIAAADAYLDFRRFDNDGPDGIPNSGDDDGLVDGGVVILHTNLDRSCFTSGVTPDAGPHPFAQMNFNSTYPFLPYQTNDIARGGGRIGINGVTVLSVQHCSGTASNASVLSHELGHLLLGLPDLYHIVPGVEVEPHELWKGRRWVLGCWDLMASGSWGCGAGSPPRPPEIAPTLSAWSRATLGWDVPLVASGVGDTVYTLDAVGRGGGTLKLPINEYEYFLVEARASMRGDAGVPGHGVLIYHIHEILPRVPATADEPRRYRVSLVEADDDSALVRIDAEGGNRGVGADAFGPAVTSFSSGQHSRARTLVGLPLPFRLEEISYNGATGRASVRVIRDP
jgi:M6 family metalloprotease-like protein